MTREQIVSAVKKFLSNIGLEDRIAVITAGAALFLHGLRKSVADIDLFVPGLPDSKIEATVDGLSIDAHREYLGIEKEILEGSYYIPIEGGGPGPLFPGTVRMMDLNSLLLLKRRLNREKDQGDIANILEAQRQGKW